MSTNVRSFAKINLGLRIGTRREDGFHELLTVYQTIALHDVIQVSVERGSGIEIQCAHPKVPQDESNTCYRVIEKAMGALGAKGRVVIKIEKRLPVQGGLGGASSNAVAALLGLERALKKSLPAEQRLRIAAEVGSDLPLFLVGGTVLGLGRGEQVYPLEDLPATACVVVTPDVGVSTPKAFAEWDRRVEDGRSHAGNQSQPGSWVEPESRSHPWKSGALAPRQRPPSSAALAPDQSTVGSGSMHKLTLTKPSDRMNELGRGLSAWLSEIYSGAPHGGHRFRRGRAENPLLALVRAGIENDFEQVVFPEYPELNEYKSALKRAGAKYASLSGSGSALYGLFGSKDEARQTAEKLRKQGWAVQPTVTLRRREYWKRIIQ